MRRFIAIVVASVLASCVQPPSPAAPHQASLQSTVALSKFEPAPINRVMDYHEPPGSSGRNCAPNSGSEGLISSFDMITKGATRDSCL